MVLVSDIDAIKALSAESARSILIYLCADAQVCQKASRLAKQIGPRPPVKRRAEDPIAVCVQCDEVFNPDNNKAQDCRYHSGTFNASRVVRAVTQLTGSFPRGIGSGL